MTRRLRRHDDFELELRISRPDFIRPPRDAQRNWLLNCALDEFVDHLHHLDRVARGFVAGRDRGVLVDRTQGRLDDSDIMEDWQIPIMRAMAEIVTGSRGDVLEVGFGRGIASTMIQELGARSHTIVECNDDVVARFHRWREQYGGRDIRLIHGKWQDTTDQLGLYDGIFFHTYPLNEPEYFEYVARSVTFAAHFFPTAAAHLREGGIFTYLTNELDSFSRAHQRLVFRYFREFTLRRVENLALPEDTRDDLWGDGMVVIGAVR